MGTLLLAVAGCKARDTDTLARIGQKSAARLTTAAGGPHGPVADGWQALRGSLSEGSLDSQVAIRLRWDRYLAGANVRVRSPASGVVRLQGTVPDAAHRQRALELAHSTAGVEQVLDELEVAPR
jgi:osmotically-inducible protein OsmY